VQKTHFEEKPVAWTSSDFRFTKKEKTIYAFQMKYSEERIAYLLRLGKKTGEIKKVSLLGSKQTLNWKQQEDCLMVQFPGDKVCAYVPCLKVELA
jgi:alpha-L-fucosidase